MDVARPGKPCCPLYTEGRSCMIRKNDATQEKEAFIFLTYSRVRYCMAT